MPAAAVVVGRAGEQHNTGRPRKARGCLSPVPCARSRLRGLHAVRIHWMGGHRRGGVLTGRYRQLCRVLQIRRDEVTPLATTEWSLVGSEPTNRTADHPPGPLPARRSAATVQASLPDELRRRRGLRWCDAAIYTATMPQADATSQPHLRSALSRYNTKPLSRVRGGRGDGGSGTLYSITQPRLAPCPRPLATAAYG